MAVKSDKVQLTIEVNGKTVTNTMGDINKELRKTNREIRNATVGSKEFFEASAKKNKLLEELKKAREASATLGKTQGLLTKGFRAIGGAIKAAFAPLAAFLAIGELVNYAREMFNVTQEVQKLKEEVNLLTGLTGPELEKATANVQAMGRAFDQDVNEILKAANTSAQAFDISVNDALSLMEKGLLATGKQGDEFLEQIKEYSVQFRDAGFTAEESFALVARSIQDGTFTDKAADSIKELRLRLGDLTSAQRDVLSQNFGEEFAKQVQSGEIDTKDALISMTKEMGVMREEGKNLTPIIANLFGGPGEDLGEDFLLSLGQIAGGLDDTIDLTNVYTRRQLEQLELEKELAAAQGELAFQLEGTGNFFAKLSTIIQTKVFATVGQIVEWFRYLPERFEFATTNWRTFANTMIEYVEKILLSFSPLVNLIETITGKEIKLPRFELDEEGLEAQKKLEGAIDADRRAFAEEQERKALTERRKKGDAERLQELRNQQRIAKEVSEKAAEEFKKAQENIERLRIEAMEEGIEKRIALLQLGAKKQIEALGGNAEQIKAQTALIEANLSQEIEAIRTKEAERLANIAKTQQEKAEEEKYKQSLADLEKHLGERYNRIVDAAIKEAEVGASQEEIDQQVKDSMLAAELQFLSDKKALQETFNLETIETEKAINDLKLESTQQRIDREIEAEQSKYAKIQEIAGQVASSVNTVIGLIAEAQQNRFDKQLSDIERNKEAELKAAGDNARKKEKIEERYQKQKDALELEQRRKQKQRDVIQSLINTALGVTKAIPNPFLMAFAAATGLAQTAIIASKKFAGGGFTGKGFGRPDFTGHKPVGIVHENEWVAPRWMVENPAFAPAIQNLETARLRGYADGGFTSTTPTDTAVDASAQSQMMETFINEIRGLRGDLRQIQFVMPIDEQAADMIADKQSDLDSRRSNTLIA